MQSQQYGEIMALLKGYQSAMILTAACELDLFSAISAAPTAPTAAELAKLLNADERAVDTLLSALTAMQFLEKTDGTFRVAPEYEAVLDSRSQTSVVPMVRHSASCARGWAQLAWAVKSGSPVPVICGLEGPNGDTRAFIQAMNSIAGQVVEPLCDQLTAAGCLDFSNMLDLGGASGTYARAFLTRNRNAKATIFDLPIALDEARRLIQGTEFESRITLHQGDFYQDPLPDGFDFVWISAIIHQQDEEATEAMFAKSRDALVEGGRIAIRDIYINEERTGPQDAAFFGVNMLVRTERGRVYTVEEVVRLLEKTGFRNAKLALAGRGMTSVITAEK
ncbi:MAG: methyltransferase, partial [Planctomycetia bacterium]|nr:methyltransferase [Planctomycetia bacterium]